MGKTLPYRVLCAVLTVLLIGTLSGCGSSKDENSFPAMADAMVLTLSDYQNLSKDARLKAIDAMTDIVFIDKKDLEEKPKQIDEQMLAHKGVEGYDAGAPGSAVAAFCVVNKTNPETYLCGNTQDVPSLSEGIALEVNDLTGRLYSKGVAGAYGLIDGLHELEYITGDSRSAEYFAPMLALRVRGQVEEVAAEEHKSGTLSGKIDYQEKGGYLRELCKLLKLDFDKVYPQMQELAGEDDEERAHSDAEAAQRKAEQKEADQELTEKLIGDYFSKSDWDLSLKGDGSYTLAARQDVKFSVGGWSVEKGVLLLGNELAEISGEGIYVKEIEEPFIPRSSEDME